ncbi:MAG: hypothetical protein ASARMPRED_001173 [Alectoria sarmentosa]|nr:MAG: hypothetical protein ASARMPRED_001173 [Alectoria sarmentosa]
MASLSGSPPPVSFHIAFERLKDMMSKDDARNMASTTMEDVWTAAKDIECQLELRRSLRSFRRIQPFLAGIEQYSKVVEVVCNGTPYLPYIWAPIKLLLQIAQNHISALEKLIDAYAMIGEAMPRFDKLSAAFKDDSEFLQVMGHFYEDILDFHRRAYKFFRKRAWQMVFDSLWKTFDVRFQAILQSLRKHRDLIDQEAHTISIVEAKVWRGQQLEQIRQWRAERAEDLDKAERERLAAQTREAVVWFGAGQEQEDIFARVLGACDSKSVICAKVIEYVQDATDSVVIFYFCSHHQSSQSQANAILRSFAAQLLAANTELAPYILDTFASQALIPTKKHLGVILEKLLSSLSSVRIVVDGLDECASSEQEGIINDLLRIKGPMPGAWMFLWVRLVMFTLEDLHFEADMREAMQTLPEGLEAVYLRTLYSSPVLQYPPAQLTVSLACVLYLISSIDLVDPRLHNEETRLQVVRCFHDLQLYVNDHWLDHLSALANPQTESLPDGYSMRSLSRGLERLTERHNEIASIKAYSAQDDGESLPSAMEEIWPQLGLSAAAQSLLNRALRYRSNSAKGDQLAERSSESDRQDDPTLFTNIRSRYQSLLEDLLEHNTLSDAASAVFTARHHSGSYLCRYRSCPRATQGFDSSDLRQKHESSHASRFRCTDPACGFFGKELKSHAAMNKHNIKYHGDDSLTTIPTTLRKAFPHSQQDRSRFLLKESSPASRKRSFGASEKHTLPDYQMELMLLEQQEKKRALMTSQEQDNVDPVSGERYESDNRNHAPLDYLEYEMRLKLLTQQNLKRLLMARQEQDTASDIPALESLLQRPTPAVRRE